MSETSSPVILSSDVERAQRLPPGQVLTRKWPILHYGNVPTFDRARWTFHIFGLVEKPWQCSYDEFIALPRIQVRADMQTAKDNAPTSAREQSSTQGQTTAQFPTTTSGRTTGSSSTY